MQNLALYTRYAWRSILRGGQRSFFAVLCIAVGVAAIVALQSTGLSIQDTIAGDARANARADVVVTTRQGVFSQAELDKIAALKPATIVDYTTSANDNGISVKKADGTKSNEFGSFYLAFVVDPAKYPFYGPLELVEARGKTLKDVLTKPGQIVLNSKMATSTGAKVGDKVKTDVTGGKFELEVAGILTTNTPSPGDGQAEFTGYGYIGPETAKTLFKPDDLLPQTVYVKTAGGTGVDDKARDTIKGLSTAFQAQTSTERNDQIKQATKGFNDVLGYVGLISLLIGSVGVVNTMLVVVGRRSTEIATIKALGMESGQTVWVFVIESAILGVIGSLIGVVLGLILGLITGQVAEGLVGRQLSYSLYPQPILIGIAVGIVTAIVFGLLPAYSASKIPPAQVLRQKTTALPRISIWATILIILLMTLVMGLISGAILGGQFVLGIIVAFATFVTCAILVLVFSGILWLVGKVPLPLGLNYKMARRNLSRGRAKSATTMLVMMVGIFSMALVLILSSSLKDTIQSTLERSFGYNVQFVARNDQEAAKALQLFQNKSGVPGLEKYISFSQANLRLVEAGGASAQDLIARKIKKEEEDAKAGRPTQPGGGGSDLSFLYGFGQSDLGTAVKLIEGQPYANDDQVQIDKTLRDDYGIKVGDKLVYQELTSGKQIALTVSGVHERKSFLYSQLPAITSNSRVQTAAAHISAFNLNFSRDKLQDGIKYLSAQFPGNEATDLSFITNVINKLIDNVTAFPVLLAFLSLIAGAVLIANNVALAVLERRTEMGVMKSIGADSGRVMNIINWETGIVGFLGGLIGLGLASLVGSVLVQQLGTAEEPAVLTISPAISLGMLLLAVGLALFATLGSAWGAAHEKPIVVLRYE